MPSFVVDGGEFNDFPFHIKQRALHPRCSEVDKDVMNPGKIKFSLTYCEKSERMVSCNAVIFDADTRGSTLMQSVADKLNCHFLYTK